MPDTDPIESVPELLPKTKKKPRKKAMSRKTGDVKPQILTLTTAAGPAADQYVTATSVLPVPRFGATKLKATIFELLWIHWYMGPDSFTQSDVVKWAWLSTISTRATAETSTLATALQDVQDPRTFGFVMEELFIVGAAGIGFKSIPQSINLTDQNGNGILIATDRLQITGGTLGGASSPGSFVAKVGYRLVNVGIQEYVGIVASQQGTGV